MPQFGHKSTSIKGPRALGLVQLSSKGKARLIPIAIMIDGKFFDAGSYKAAPVPMALDFGIVYEGFRSGVSQGIFTITQPGQLNHSWIAEGTWFPAGTKAPDKNKKYSTPVIEDESKDGPPVLHRRSEKSDSDSDSADKDKNKDKPKDDAKDQKPTTPSSPTTAAPTASAPSSPDATKTPAPSATADAPPAKAASTDENISDPNRPVLRRGKPDSSAHSEPFTTFDALPGSVPAAKSSAGTGAGSGKTDAKATDSAAAVPQVTMIPAISDAAGPDPRPYIYDLKPAEVAMYRSKIQDLAIAQMHAHATAGEAAPARTKGSAGKPASKLPKPSFDAISLRVFDLSNSNEPVLVLLATTHPSTDANGNVAVPQEITLIARTNLDGDLKKLFFSQTDSQHLDVAPRMELIDAVDADGDGRGELLFRRTYDGGSAYAIYRVTSDLLWPLFEGTP